jgi:hypothetical protein
MFEIGDRVMVSGFDKPIYGKIVSFYYDEGNVWTVLTDGGNHLDCVDDELTPANRTSSYNGIERYIYS